MKKTKERGRNRRKYREMRYIIILLKKMYIKCVKKKKKVKEKEEETHTHIYNLDNDNIHINLQLFHITLIISFV